MNFYPLKFEGLYKERIWGGRGLEDELGKDLPRFVEFLSRPASQILERWFESEPLRSTLATDAVIGAMASPATPAPIIATVLTWL
jgi:phytoene dehydrogenase-like protein